MAAAVAEVSFKGLSYHLPSCLLLPLSRGTLVNLVIYFGATTL